MLALGYKRMTKLLAAVAFFTAASAMAGTKDGGGGGAYVCRNADGSIRSARMADLWEAENTPFHWPHKKGKLKISYSNAISAESQFAKMIERISRFDPILGARVRSERDRMFAEKNSLPDSVSIALPEDLKVGYFPTGCPPEGVMFYNSFSEQLDVREDLFSALATQTDIAAAWAHEAIYKLLREWRFAEDSKMARRLVACLLSGEEGCLKARPLQVPSDRIVYQCENARFSLKLFPERAITSPSDLVKDKRATYSYRFVLEKTDFLKLAYLPWGGFSVQDRKKDDRYPHQLYGSPFQHYAAIPYTSDLAPHVVMDKFDQDEGGVIHKIGIKEFAYGYAKVDEEHFDRYPVNQELNCRQIQ